VCYSWLMDRAERSDSEELHKETNTWLKTLNLPPRGILHDREACEAAIVASFLGWAATVGEHSTAPVAAADSDAAPAGWSNEELLAQMQRSWAAD
jgi:hypothetical protein